MRQGAEAELEAKSTGGKELEEESEAKSAGGKERGVFIFSIAVVHRWSCYVLTNKFTDIFFATVVRAGRKRV